MLDVDPRKVIALILGGGRGTRLYPLTQFRAKPAVPLAAKYRLIDIPISNCIHSNINKIFVLTQFLSNSLHRHIRQTYRFDHFSGGFVELMAAQQSMEGGTDWYEGTADAVRKNLQHLDQRGVEYILILSGDQLYRMNYLDMLRTHIINNADVTIAALPVERKAARALGVMRCDQRGRVTGFLEKPQTDHEIDMVKMDPGWLSAQGLDCQGRDCLASMGLYIFNRDLLFEILAKTSYQDFGKEVFPAAIRSRKVHVHLFDGYWEDIGTIRAFYDANLQLTRHDAPFDFLRQDHPVYSRARFLPPTLIDGATVTSSLIADGCRIGKGCVIENSVIGLRCVIGDNVTIKDSILMGSDLTDSPADLVQYSAANRPPLGIGNGSRIVGAILDKNAHIGRNVVIENSKRIENCDAQAPCLIRDGIPILCKDGILPDGFHLED